MRTPVQIGERIAQAPVLEYSGRIMNDIGTVAKEASTQLSSLTGEIKNSALHAISGALERNADTIFRENGKDLESGEKAGLSGPVMKRLKFDRNKLNTLIAGIQELIRIEEPVGRVLQATELDRGLELYKVSSPIGVIGIIFESRPDALVQISSLCLKSGNSVILKGGSEALHSNRILYRTILDAGLESGMPDGWIELLETREDVSSILKMDDSVDLIIPRGSNEFVRYIMENTHIPVLGHADGICHVYIDAKADAAMAERIAIDSKTQYVAVCNAAETILVHREIAPTILPRLFEKFSEKGVIIKGCPATRRIISAEEAVEKDWRTEYLDLIVSIKIVDGVDEAVKHINHYGSRHTDAIVTEDPGTADIFMDRVDSASVMQNCSTRFSDGYRYGLGAEVGISTSKIHARGPVGIEGLLTYKWKLKGSGQIVADYSGAEGRSFTHKLL